MPKPSILFVNRVYPPHHGATGRVLRDLARAFARNGWDVRVVTTGEGSAEEKDGPVRVVRVGAGPARKSCLSYIWVWIRLFLATLRQPRPHVLVTMTDPPMFILAGRWLARLKNCLHIHWCQDLYPDLFPVVGVKMPELIMRLFRRISRRSMKACDKVVVTGRCMARHLTHTGVEPAKITVIPNWPDPELAKSRSRKGKDSPGEDEDGYKAAPPIRRQDKDNGKRLFVDDEPRFRIMYAGTLSRAHRLEPMLEAAELVHTDHPEIEFVFVGEGPAFERLANERASRGLDNIRLLPRQPARRLKELMESGDVHLISMKQDAAGLLVPSKLYAALAVARPCILIGPEESEVARVLRDYKAGMLVSPEKPADLAQAILHYRNNGDDWFAAHEGAGKAGSVFVPDESLKAWIKRATDLLRSPVRQK